MLSFQLLTTLVIAQVYGQATVVVTWPQEATTTAAEAGSPLHCRCSPWSRYCEPDGRCNAAVVGARIRQEVRSWRDHLARLRREPYNRDLRHWQEVTCSFFTAQANVTDLYALEFLEEDYVPVCAWHSDHYRACSLGKAVSGGSVLSASDVAEAIQRLHAFLNCDPVRHPLPRLAGDRQTCSEWDECNATTVGSAALPLWALLLAVLCPGLLLLLCLAALVWRYREVIGLSRFPNRAVHTSVQS